MTKERKVEYIINSFNQHARDKCVSESSKKYIISNACNILSKEEIHKAYSKVRNLEQTHQSYDDYVSQCSDIIFDLCCMYPSKLS